MSADSAAVYDAVAREVFDAGRDSVVDVQPLGALLLSEFAQARLDRQETEQRWLDDLRQYKGQYSAEEEEHMQGPSRAFVRKTRTKVKTLDARVADMLFPAGGQDNWAIEPTPMPQLSAMQQAQVLAQLEAAAQESGTPPDEAAVAQVVTRVARKAADRMALLVSDQLTETRYRKAALGAIHDCHVYGTGCLKGPVVARRARTVFRPAAGGGFEPHSEYYVAPQIKHVPIWQVFPDMSSADLAGCRYVWERHILSPSDMAELAQIPGFDAQRVRDYLAAHPLGHSTDSNGTEAEIRRLGMRSSTQLMHQGYEVLERWGWLMGEQLAQVGVEVPEPRRHEAFFGCVWMLASGEVIRAHLAEIDGSTWPYHLYHFDKDETSFFGEGLPAIMRDDQAMINAATRLLLDNAALSAGPMWEVNPHLLATSEAASLTNVHAWRVWLRNNQQPGQPAVRAVSIDGRLGDLQSLRQLFEASADETTAIPRYMSGENATAGAAGTAAGMSMLMAAANIVIKDLITSWDEGITRPLIEALYRWNMRHSKDDSVKGDYLVQATGTTSLVAKEVRSRQLNEFAAMTANPLDAPYIKRDVLNRLRAQAHELPDVVKTEQEVDQELKAAQGNEAAAMQQQMLQAQLQEAIARGQEVAARAELQAARAKEALANVELSAARRLDATMEAFYAALQAAGITGANPLAAQMADAMLQDAGYVGAQKTEEAAQQAAEQMAALQAAGSQDAGAMPAAGVAGVQPATGHSGVRRGIQTLALGDQEAA